MIHLLIQLTVLNIEFTFYMVNTFEYVKHFRPGRYLFNFTMTFLNWCMFLKLAKIFVKL